MWAPRCDRLARKCRKDGDEGVLYFGSSVRTQFHFYSINEKNAAFPQMTLVDVPSLVFFAAEIYSTFHLQFSHSSLPMAIGASVASFFLCLLMQMFDNFMGVLREFMSDIGSGKVVVESLNHVSSPQEGSTFGFRCQAWVRRWQTRRKPGVSPGGRSSFLHWDCQRTRGIAHVMLKYSVALSTTAQQRLLLHKYDHVGRGVQQKPCTFPRLQTFIPVKSF